MNLFVSQIKPAGTRTFRASATQLFHEYGGNAQNPNRNTLQIFTAKSPLHRLAQSDQAGAEALVVAYLSERGNYRKLFENGIKPHSYLAMHLFPQRWHFEKPAEYYLSAPIEELPASPGFAALMKEIGDSGDPYDIGKRTAHAKSYRMGPRTFIMANLKQSSGKLALKFDEAKKFLTMFERLFPEVISWQDEIEKEVKANRVLYNLFGFPRRFDRKMSDGYIREAISFKPQSTVGCLTHIACTKMQEFIETNQRAWDLLNNKHDSFMVQCPTEVEAIECCRVQQKLLAHTFTGRDGVQFTMKSESKVGHNWADWHEHKNPQGLRKVKV